MNPNFEKYYLGEIIRQASNVNESYDEMQNFLCAGDSINFFRAVENFIQHVAAISQILWPPSENARSKYLLKSLNLTTDMVNLKCSAHNNMIICAIRE